MKKIASLLFLAAAVVTILSFLHGRKINRYNGAVGEGWFVGERLVFGDPQVGQAQPKPYPDGWYWEAEGTHRVFMAPQPIRDVKIEQSSGVISEGFFFGSRLLRGRPVGQAAKYQGADGRWYWGAPNLQPVPVL